MSRHRISAWVSPPISFVLTVAVLATNAPAQTTSPASAASAASVGVSFRVVMQLIPPANRGGQLAEPSILFGSGSFADGRGRIDIDSSRGSIPFTKGDYFVIDSGHTLLVRPSVQTYAEVESPIQHAFTRLAGQLTNPQMAMSAVKVNMEDLGVGGMVARVKTEHFRVQSEYVQEVGTRQLNSEVTTDMWVAKLPVQFTSPVEGSVLRPQLSPVLNPVVDQLATFSKQIASAGAPVKLVTTTTYALGSATWQTVQSAELSNIRFTYLDADAFKIPERFRKAQ